MCRRCGEQDRRGPAHQRRRRRERLLNGEASKSVGGNGELTACVWCGVPLANVACTLTFTADGMIVWLEVLRLEVDRLGGCGTPYAFWNVVPACGPCNRGRTYDSFEIPEGCIYGPETLERILRRPIAPVIPLEVFEPFDDSPPADVEFVS